MLAAEIESIVPAWKEMKDRQWAAFKNAMPGLQLMVSGPKATQYTLVCSAHDETFYEAIVFGQLPQVVLESHGSRLNPRIRDMAEDKKPYDKKSIDLYDDQIEQVINAWKNGRSALTLPFVEAVRGADGKLTLR